MFFNPTRDHSSFACMTSANGSMSYQGKGVICLTAFVGGDIDVKGVYRCKCRNLCPLCADIEGKILGAKIGSWVMRELNARGRGYAADFTISHKVGDSQEMLEKQLLKGWQHLARRGFLKGLKWVRSIETPYSLNTGWHPHYHCIFFGDGFDANQQIEDMHKEWCDFHNKRGFKADRRAQWSEAIYNAQGAGEYMSKAFGAGLEVGHSAGKSSKSGSLSFVDLFTSDNKFLQARAFEYFDRVKGSRRFDTSRGDLKPDLTIDDDLLEVADATEKVGEVYVAIDANQNINRFMDIIDEYRFNWKPGDIDGFSEYIRQRITEYNINAFVLDECDVSFNNDHQE